MEKIPIARSLLIGLLGALVAALVAIGFLAGRESARPALHDPPRAPIALAPSPDYDRAPIAPPPSTPIVAPLPIAAPIDDPPSIAAPSVGAPPPGVPIDPTVRTAIADYFSAIDHLSQGPAADNSEAFAAQLMKAALDGDTSGFERFLHDAEASQSALKAIRPPPPCRAYHQSALEIMGESLGMLRAIRTSLATGDARELATVGAGANQLQGRVRALDAERKAILAVYAPH